MTKHEYEGGSIDPMGGEPVQMHYHMDYFVEGSNEGGAVVRGMHLETGFIIDVNDDGTFSVIDEEWDDAEWGDAEEEWAKADAEQDRIDAGEMPSAIEPQIFPDLESAVSWCFEQYAARHPGQKIRPVMGAGAPNETLRKLGLDVGE